MTPNLRAQVVFSVGSTPARGPVAPSGWGLSQAEWGKLIETAVREVFEMMLGCPVNRVEPTPEPDGDITAMVGLAGGLSGVVSVRCDLETANLLASKMLGINTKEAESATRDALGEIANVVAGTLKTKVPGLEDTCFLSTPTVVIGHGFKVYSLGNSTTTEVLMDVEGAHVWFILDAHH